MHKDCCSIISEPTCPKCVGGITWPTRMLKVILGGKNLLATLLLLISTAHQSSFSMTKKKRSLRNGKLKANRLKTEESKATDKT